MKNFLSDMFFCILCHDLCLSELKVLLSYVDSTFFFVEIGDVCLIVSPSKRVVPRRFPTRACRAGNIKY